MNEAERAWPIIQYWHDGKPPDYIVELLESFRVHNPEMPHLLFDALAAEELIAEYFGDREVAAFRSCAVPAMQADYFRYCAAAALGGLVCDADVRCRAELRGLMPTPGEGWLVLRPHGVVVNGLFAFGAPEHPLAGLAVRIATANIERRCDSVFMVAGPAVLTMVYWAHRRGSLDAFKAAEWAEYADRCRDALGDPASIDCVFEGVAIKSASEVNSYVQSGGMDFPYKETDVHWARFEGEIYKDPSAPFF